MKLGQRVKKARDYADLEQEDLVREIRARFGGIITQQTISRIERGGVKTTAYVVHIAVVCRVRPEWLALEDGPMLASEKKGNNPGPFVPRTQDERNWMLIHRAMSKAQRKVVQEIFQPFAEKHNL